MVSMEQLNVYARFNCVGRNSNAMILLDNRLVDMRCHQLSQINADDGILVCIKQLKKASDSFRHWVGDPRSQIPFH